MLVASSRHLYIRATTYFSVQMSLYHDEDIIKKVWRLKREHPDWGVRRIGDELGVSKDKVHRILKRIEKGDIEVTEDGKVIDHSKPKGIVALEKEMSRKALKQLERKTVGKELQNRLLIKYGYISVVLSQV